jgi:hypothetical protein
MKERMRILIGYDGSECADAAIDDLRRAGLPSEATADVGVVDGKRGLIGAIPIGRLLKLLHEEHVDEILRRGGVGAGERRRFLRRGDGEEAIAPESRRAIAADCAKILVIKRPH